MGYVYILGVVKVGWKII